MHNVTWFLKCLSFYFGLFVLLTPLLWEQFSLTSNTTIIGGLLMVLGLIFYVLEVTIAPVFRSEASFKPRSRSGAPDKPGTPLRKK